MQAKDVTVQLVFDPQGEPLEQILTEAFEAFALSQPDMQGLDAAALPEAEGCT